MEKDMTTKYPAQQKYDRANTRTFGIKINRRTDPDIMEKLESLDNITGYIKQLIRDDIVKHGGITRKPIVKETRTEISDEFTEPE